MTEEWRAIAGTRGYEVSSLGRVRSVPRAIRTASGQVRRYRGIIISPNLNGEGYPRAWVRLECGAKRNCLVHILVAEAFIGPRPPGMEVSHRDGVRMNAVLYNLRYDTPKGNAADKVVHGTHLEHETHPGHVLTAVQVQEIRSRDGETQRSRAAEFGVSRSNIAAIDQERSWRAPARERAA